MKHLIIISLVLISLTTNAQSYNWKQPAGESTVKLPEQTQLVDKNKICGVSMEDLARQEDRVVLFAPPNVCITFSDVETVVTGPSSTIYCVTASATLMPVVPINVEQPKTDQP